MATDASEKVRTYRAASVHYLENALLMIQQDEVGKASELLWGSVAEALQALASSRSIQLQSHRSLHWFIGVLSKELNDSTIAQVFYMAENLHQKGFHEVELDITDVSLAVDPIRALVAKLLGLIPDEFLEEPKDLEKPTSS